MTRLRYEWSELDRGEREHYALGAVRELHAERRQGVTSREVAAHLGVRAYAAVGRTLIALVREGALNVALTPETTYTPANTSTRSETTSAGMVSAHERKEPEMAATKSPAKKRASSAKKGAAKKTAAKKAAAKKGGGAKKAASSGRRNGAEEKPLELTQGQVNAYLKAEASTDQDCPQEGKPFVQESKGTVKVFLRLEGLAKHLGEAPGRVRKAVEALGFTRRPFSYTHSKKGQTSASYYSAPAKDMARGVDHRTVERKRAEGKPGS